LVDSQATQDMLLAAFSAGAGGMSLTGSVKLN